MVCTRVLNNRISRKMFPMETCIVLPILRLSQISSSKSSETNRKEIEMIIKKMISLDLLLMVIAV